MNVTYLFISYFQNIVTVCWEDGIVNDDIELMQYINDSHTVMINAATQKYAYCSPFDIIEEDKARRTAMYKSRDARFVHFGNPLIENKPEFFKCYRRRKGRPHREEKPKVIT